MYSNCKQHWRLRKCVSRNLGSLAHCTGCWHTGMSRSIQEGPGGLGYLSFRDDQGARVGLLTLWTLVDRLWILLADLGVQAALGVRESRHPILLSLLANLVRPGVPACPVCPGSPAVPQGPVLLWLRRRQGGPAGPGGLAGCDWSGNRLESDSASD